jgi:lysophospholipase L1-like esterase
MVRIAFFVAAFAVAASSASALEPGQLEPKRMIAIGDSITRAFDATLPGDNLSQSWSSGSHGFLQQLLGLPDVNSHNQRITRAFGGTGRRNAVAARNGADVKDLYGQALGIGSQGYTYATVLLGGNDVCKGSIAELPTDEEFFLRAAYGLAALVYGMPPGATIQVVAIPDIKRLYDVGIDKTALGIIDCKRLWSLTALGFPCGSMLSPDNTPADRDYVRSRNVQYNRLLEFAVALLQKKIPDRFLSFTDVTYTYPFTASDVSNIDCYHPSSRGQRAIASGTWAVGPFRAYATGN